MSSSKGAPSTRKSKGRQKVKMEKMENQSNLQVTYSKRRAGLFKKASELCTLCGAEASIVVFSPADKVYCFGHPNVQTVLDKNSAIRKLNVRLTRAEVALRAEKRRTEELEAIKKTGQAQKWFPTGFDDFNYDQLSALKESILDFRKNLDAKLHEDMLRVSDPNPPMLHQENPNINNNINNINNIINNINNNDDDDDYEGGFLFNPNPAFNNAPFPVGPNDFFAHGVGGINGGMAINDGFVVDNPAAANININPMIASGSNNNGGFVPFDNYGGGNNAMLFGGGAANHGYTAASSSRSVPNYDPSTANIGSTSFGGYNNNMGYDPRMF
ncbi:hypothetical protein MIMGU_mgv1a021041mg [Erythranthe guttata]|uniref:MADS-box domain-containing protein n=1 Tax=Erythranthe guttata TaxID=4155 RepID=A0A022RB35_ERYGU|nr:hypothetical protein MIMGU_mgv1a021041mg [Erythranthe guttata]